MKKILIAFDGLGISDHTARYAMRIAKDSDALLVGVFLYDLRYVNLTYGYSWNIPVQAAYEVQNIQKDDDKKIDENIKSFSALCEEMGVHFKVHLDNGVPLAELLKESAFADLIIIDSKTSFFAFGDQQPSTFLRDLLVESRCPVMVVPPKSHDIKQVVIAYDGSESSVYAMKMFNYVFPEWSDLKTVIVTINKSSTNHIPRNRNIKDLADHHFKKVEYKVLHGNVVEQLEEFLKKSGKDVLVVMGSYGRSALSRTFHASLSNKILKDVKVPLFITHQ